MTSGEKAFWDRSAKFYTFVQERQHRWLYDRIAQLIQPFLNKKMKVLELGCGTGQLSLRLARHVDLWVATDFSEQMIAQLQRRPKPCNLQCSVQDACDLTYLPQCFDLVLIANALHVMPHPEEALKQIGRVCKSGGFLVAPTFIQTNHTRSWRIWLMTKLGFKIFHLWTEQQLSDMIQNFGFSVEMTEVIDAKPMSECVVVAKKV